MLETHRRKQLFGTRSKSTCISEGVVANLKLIRTLVSCPKGPWRRRPKGAWFRLRRHFSHSVAKGAAKVVIQFFFWSANTAWLQLRRGIFADSDVAEPLAAEAMSCPCSAVASVGQTLA
ncbi:hypothetical protein BS50DRAFT_270847 [Corynespora cassiicola Philippines]|uniref:Uncharacterized protein n=1 Tax=Corynespora cassiicola Philippines TaxID=1448308 RepID=A0A2T2P0E3_CORCC|nr:hypothetical protein BS50DRAFT_270847 [Corynespora cassiicola Philippines]